MDSYEGLIIRQDSLIRSKWVEPVYKDEESTEIIKEGYYSEEDITDKLPYFLFETCIIEDGTTLRDFFKLLKKHCELFSVIQKRNWFNDYLDFGLNSPIMDVSRVYNPKDLEIDYLEVYKDISHTAESVAEEDKYLEWGCIGNDTKTKTKIKSKGDVTPEETSIGTYFHAMSLPITKVYCDLHPSEGYKVGDRTPIGFFGSILPEFIDYPLKLRNSINICTTTYDPEPVKYEHMEFKGYADFNFAEIVEAIFYEISFHGSPSDTSKFEEDIEKSLDEIKKDNVE